MSERPKTGKIIEPQESFPKEHWIEYARALKVENEALKGELREERRRLLTELYQNSAISEYQFNLAMKEIDALLILTGKDDDAKDNTDRTHGKERRTEELDCRGS